MIVDDHADVRYLLRAIVEDAGTDVVVGGEAASGEEAMLAIDSVDPDVVLLDAQMPVRDGFQTAELILAHRPEQRIVLCSTVIDDEIRSRAAAAGITACVAKDAFEEIPVALLASAGPGSRPGPAVEA
jgi:DNA-binding NarL/FixJ family response regulator